MTEKPINQMTPKEWITHKRRELGGLVPFAAHEYDLRALKELISRIPESDREAARKIWMERRKRSLADVHDELMNTYRSAVLPLLQKDELAVAEDTYFGILPTRDFNGYAGFTPRGDRIVVLHEGLGYTINFWSNWLMRMLDEGRDHLADSPDKLLHALAHIKYVWYGRPPKPPLPDIHPKTGVSWNLAECLTMSTLSFVMGHELGHLLNKDTAYTNSKADNHRMELKTDVQGLSVGLRYGLVWGAKFADDNDDNYFTKMGLFGPLFALALMTVFGDSESISHPSASQRLAHVENIFDSQLRSIVGEHYRRFVEAVDADLVAVLLQQSARFARAFRYFGEVMREIDIGDTAIDNSWLTAALRQTTA
jgi:hypothetical protein